MLDNFKARSFKSLKLGGNIHKTVFKSKLLN